MSEFLSSAAEKMGVPEALVARSAEARAKASGTSTDDILAAWAGGEAAPAAAAPPPTDDAPVEATEDTTETTDTPEPETKTEPEPAGQPAAAPVRAAAGPRVPPVLVGRNEKLAGVALGAVALLALSLLVGFFVAAQPEETNLAYTSEVDFTAIALDGQDVYRAQGCAACHTQVVRPVVADAGLGGVSMADTNQVIGSRRVGPDLAHIGSRVEADAVLYGILDGGSGHPPYRGLGQSDLDALVAYLMESK